MAGCVTDSATRLASDLEAGSRRLGASAGARTTVVHVMPSKAGECEGPYKVQIDAVGALFVWCRDAAGNTVSSHSTTSHRGHVFTPRTFLLDKAAGSPLIIELERRDGKAVITEVR